MPGQESVVAGQTGGSKSRENDPFPVARAVSLASFLLESSEQL